MTSEEKIKNVIDVIREKSELLSTPSEVIILDQDAEFKLSDLSFEDYISILKKLEKQYKVIKIKKFAEYKPSILSRADPYDFREDKSEIFISSGFDKFYEQYSEVKKETVTSMPFNVQVDNNEKLLTIKFTKTREIILNDIFLLSKPESFGENESFFEYLYNHQNTELNISNIEKELNLKLEKPVSKILENLGFRKDLKRVFFKLGQGKILFKNPIPKSDLTDSGTRIPISVR